ncbi:MAG: thiamine phosphate synthase [Ruminococcus sp.]|nr:thiamine phosphate synthase [Ruminococcus sp.]
MSDIICVTNRGLCSGNFLTRIEKIAKAKPKAIILREKDLNKEDYKILALKVMEICRKYDTPCILHNFADVAIELKAEFIHLPLHILQKMSDSEKVHFSVIGASCHSVDDAIEAEKLGCSYITVGHIFDTECKKGIAGRGLDFLKDVCNSVSIPAYAIGGIDKINFADVCKVGANGACIMSGIMRCDDVNMYLEGFQDEV